MLLYLTNNENLDLFDFITEESGMLIEKLSGQWDLNKFIIQDKRNLNHFSYMAINLESLEDEIEDLIDALNAIRAIYDMRIILYAKTIERGILNKIIDETDIYNIISAKTIDKIQKEIRICIGKKGMSKHYAKMAINLEYDKNQDIEYKPSLDIQEELIEEKDLIKEFDAKNIKIIISGVMNRIGTTTSAMNLAVFLSSLGYKVSYTEGNGNNHLNSIHSHFFFNNPINNNHFADGKVDYYFNGNIPTDNYNFNIIDIGVLTSKNLKITEIGDINILCAGSKPYEVSCLTDVLKMIGEREKLNIILPIESKGDIDKIDEFKDLNIHFAKYSSSLFDIDINFDVWKNILFYCLWKKHSNSNT